MTKLIASPATAIANIQRFESEVASSPGLQDRLAYARAWYAHIDQNGRTCFGPSKFIGYQDLTAADILSDAQHDRDGRRTEAQLQQWFTTVEPSSPLYEELNTGLVEFLARFGKAPSTKMRINVLREALEQADQPNPNGAIVDLMVAVAKTLPIDQRNILRARLSV